ncbi:hypothetical protein [Azohydromonas aeria]|nr:hypothetical protein [Azohydromonas aeria]
MRQWFKIAVTDRTTGEYLVLSVYAHDVNEAADVPSWAKFEAVL